MLVGHNGAAVSCREALLELVDRRGQLLVQLVAELLGFADLLEDAVIRGAQVIEEFGLEAADVLDRNGVQMSLRTKEDRDDLLLDRERLVLRLLEQLDESGTALQLRLRGGVEVRS